MNHKHRVVTAIAVTTALGFTAVACGDDSGGSSSCLLYTSDAADE